MSTIPHRLNDVNQVLATLRHPYGERARYMVVSAGARRILVVDDDPMVATTVQRVLRAEGYEVDVALGGPQAIERAQVTRPDLVVLDLMMPGIDGLGVSRQLRAARDRPAPRLTP